jgi:hypothetical protein
MFSQGQGSGSAPPMPPQMFSQGGQYAGGSPQQIPAYRTVAQGQAPQAPQTQPQQPSGPPQVSTPTQLPADWTREKLEKVLRGISPPIPEEAVQLKLEQFDKMKGTQLTQRNQQLQAQEAEKRLAAPKPLVAPPTRTIMHGLDESQMEMQPDGTWKQIGQGPRSTKTVAAPGTGGTGGTAGGSSAGGVPSAGAKGLTGEAYLKTLPAGMAATVKAIAEGRETFSEAGRGSKERKALMDAVNLYNPDYSSVGVKANAGALMQNSKDLAAIRPYKEMLDTNIDIAIDLGRKVIKSDSAKANRSLNWIKQNAGDHPDTAEYLAQINFVQTEAARVLSNPRLVGQLSDSARHEMQDVVSGNMPLNSSERVLNRIKKDGENRVNALVKEHDRLSGKADASTTGAQPYSDADKEARYQAWKAKNAK